MPQTMRGIKKFSIGLSVKQENKKNFNLNLQDDNQNQIEEENDYGDEEDTPLRDEQG